MEKIPVIIDTDPGVDDFLALMLAKSSDRLDIKGICAVGGNQTLEITSRNAIDIADAIKIDAPVAKGAAKPLNHTIETAGHVHGESGIGNVKLPKSTREFDKRYAWDLMYDVARENSGKLEIIAIGPLTNVAIALLKYPDIHQHIKRIVIMGGSAGKGNRTPYAEFNIWGDPFAADIVFKSHIPVVMVGLNATHQTMLDEKDIEELNAIPSSMSEEINTLLTGMLEVYRGFGHAGAVIHDALTIAYVINEDVLKCNDYYVAVETREGLNYGRTVVDLDNSHRDKEKNVSVAMEVNFEMFKDMMKEMVAYYK